MTKGILDRPRFVIALTRGLLALARLEQEPGDLPTAAGALAAAYALS